MSGGVSATARDRSVIVPMDITSSVAVTVSDALDLVAQAPRIPRQDSRPLVCWPETASRTPGVHMTDRLRFGIFMAPFHPAGENPTLALARDLELIQHLDRLGCDEAWIGEHHSAGSEIIASPEIFIAAAAERTRHIKLGTGVISVSYHNPLWVAERAVLLDHLTRGRFMLGLGPGSLPTDAAMIGLDQSQTRAAARGGHRHHHAPAAQRRAGHLQERPLGPARRPPAPAPVLQPAVRCRRRGGRLARRARSSPASTGSGCSRSAPPRRPASTPWRCTGASSRNGRRSSARPSTARMAPRRPDAHRRDPRAGATRTSSSASSSGSATSSRSPRSRRWPSAATTSQEMIDFVNETGLGSIGTAEDAVAQIERLMKQSNGGFGCYLLLAHEWAEPRGDQASYELIAQHVFPQFQGQAYSTNEAKARAEASRPEMAAAHLQAVEAVTEKYHAEVGSNT